MRRTTKRRLGLAGLVVAGMILLVFVVSFKFGVRLHKHPPPPTTMAEIERLRLSSGVVTLPGVMINKGCADLLVSKDILNRDWYWSFGVSPAYPMWWRFLPRFISFNKNPGMAIPLWIPTFLIAIPSFILWRRNRNLGEGYCGCGYNLTGNVSGVCPECGKKLEAPNTGDKSDKTATRDCARGEDSV